MMLGKIGTYGAVRDSLPGAPSVHGGARRSQAVPRSGEFHEDRREV